MLEKILLWRAFCLWAFEVYTGTIHIPLILFGIGGSLNDLYLFDPAKHAVQDLAHQLKNYIKDDVIIPVLEAIGSDGVELMHYRTEFMNSQLGSQIDQYPSVKYLGPWSSTINLCFLLFAELLCLNR